jgi:alkanesulfonate monooxygenase SsuD/methylene tetrahydromethanopterin reductase-like flavin-dependent oxidoreductase (luciferase family)
MGNEMAARAAPDVGRHTLRIGIRYDLRSPSFGIAADHLYRAALEQCAWADSLGFDYVQLSEHHGSPDGYCPSPLVLAAGIAGRTQRMRLLLAAVILPLHDPLRLAEDVAVLDLVSAGRVDLVCVPGYRPSEFRMAGLSMSERMARFEEGLKVLRSAWTGEAFTYRGVEVRVTPRPLQEPHPPLYVGGRSPRAARMAAALADGMFPASRDPRLRQTYMAERRRLGLSPGYFHSSSSAHSVFVTDDPERTWAEIGRHALHETTSYAEWGAEGGMANSYTTVPDIAALRKLDFYKVVTPDACLELARSLGRGQSLVLHPLVGGTDPDIGWASLDLFSSKVLPRLAETEAGRRTVDPDDPS